MLTTSLLSLSIHETLTFDGVEIALHPDLFAEPRQNLRPALHHSGSSTSLATAPATGKAAHKRLHSFSDALPDLSGDVEGTGEGDTGPSVSAASSVVANNRKLEVGDMIEIKVWDPIEGLDRSHHEHSPRVFRRRSSPPSASIRGSVAGDQTKSSVTTTPIIDTAASSDLQSSKGGTASISMQYSTDSGAGNESFDQVASVRDEDSSTVSSTEQGSDPEKHSKVTSPRAADTPPSSSGHESSKPPPVPRPRLHTVDNASRNNAPSKPNVVGRNRTSATAPEEARRSSPVSVPSSKAQSHSRDISDMTLDTVFGAEKTGDASRFQPSALGTFSLDSYDNVPAEEDQTALSRIIKTHSLRLSFVIVVSGNMLTSLKGSARTQISMLRQVADLYDLSSYDMVTVNKVEKSDEASALEEVSADFVTISFKEQFISRADMHYFQNSLIGRWIYEGERLVNPTKGITAHAREIRHQKRLARSGIVTSDTMITFRSRSARIVWLVQISSEMWDYASPYEAGEHDQDALEEEASSELYFDKFVSFMYRLFEKWQALEVTHSLTVIFFSRTYLGSTRLGEGTGGHVNMDVYGRKYVDHFKTVIENETCADWDSLVVRVKRDFIKYPFEVGWDLSRDGGCRPSTATQGNILEAINVTLNLLQYHYLDRDLHRTGNSIVVVSAGNGVFEVDRGLAGITYQRMMDQGIGSDMISLRLPPLHTAPFFHYNNDVVSADPQRVDTDTTYHEVPHWMHLSFVGYDDATPSAEPFAPIARELGVVQDPQALIEIGPNGFLLPRKEQMMARSVKTEPPTVSSFSRLANDAASPRPSRSQTQQRRLISGRDFSDILEACRPSTSGYSVPSSLSSVMLMQASSAREKGADRESKSRSLTRSPPLKEWGAVDYDEVRRRLMLMSSARTVSGQSLLGVGLGEPHSEKSDSSEKSSPSSSFASQISSFFGRSPAFSSVAGFHGRGGSVNEFRIHRSPSIVMELPDGSQGRRPESNESLQSSRAEERSARGKPVGSKASKTNGGEHSDSEEIDVDELRQTMAQYDEGFFRRAELKSIDSAALVLASGTISPPSHSPVLGSTPSQENVPALVGGLGAAISQYQQHGSLGDNLSTMDDASVKRVLSSGKMVAPHGQMMSAFARPQSLGPFLDRSGLSQSPYYANVGMPIESESPHQLTRGKFVHRKSQDGLNPLRTYSLGTSPPSMQTRSQPIGTRQSSSNRSLKMNQKSTSPSRESLVSRSRKHSHHRNKRILNPFKQKDEEEVLAERSHNRRRWSHVFPLGEIEFKRNAGPNWKSLCQPAILPLTIDYLPTPQELADMTFSHWNKLLGGMEHSHYTSYSDLLMEMVRQRLIQDFQLVPPAVVHESRSRKEVQTGTPEQRLASLGPRQGAGEKTFLPGGNKGPEKQDDGVIEHVLSMGYIVHVLKFDPTSENPIISVIQYNSRNSQQELSAAFDYKYFSYSASTQSFERAVQVFKKYGNQYLWSRSDALVCDGESTLTSEDMRFRRIMFALVPPSFDDKTAENEYIERFRKLEEYLRKLGETSEDSDNERLEIQVVSSDDEGQDPSEELTYAKRRRLGTTELMKRFTIHLKKGKRDPYEWMELAVQPKFNTKRTYRIIFNWLVASSSKVDSQVQLLQRRCTQYGLQIFVFPQRSITSNIFLNPLTAPWIHCVRDKSMASQLDRGILERDFVDDGIFMTEPNFLDCIEDAKDYTFPRNWRSQIAKIPARQFVHRTGTLFIRLMMDEKGWAILAAIENKGLINRDAALWAKARDAFQEIERFVEGLVAPKGLDSDT